jgi:hypothetical protein
MLQSSVEVVKKSRLLIGALLTLADKQGRRTLVSAALIRRQPSQTPTFLLSSRPDVSNPSLPITVLKPVPILSFHST